MDKSTPRLPSPAIVVAIIALFVSLGGTGYAASQLSGSPTAVAGKAKKKKKPVKILRGKTGPTGPSGPTGVTGAQGKDGVQAKEGPQGKEGPKGESGTAIAFAHVQSSATLDSANSSGVVDVQRFPGFVAGFYCLYGNFSAHVATATINYSESSGNEYVQEAGLTAAQIKSCPASGTGAPAKAIVIIRDPKTTELANAGFYILFN